MKSFIGGFIVLMGLMMLFVIYRVSSVKMDAENAAQDRETAAQAARQPTIEKWRATGDKVHKKAADLCQKNSAWSIDDCETIAERKIHIGMNKQQVIAAWGKPKQVNETLTQNLTHQQWVYGLRSYIYFEDDKLTSMQTPGE
jgi:hypothetical protein